METEGVEIFNGCVQKGGIMKEDYVYSLDGETFYELDEILDELERNYDPGTYTVERGVTRRVNHSDFVRGDLIIEGIQETCCDQHGDYAEDYLSEITDDDKRELELIISDWLEAKVGFPKFFAVDKIEEVELINERKE